MRPAKSDKMLFRPESDQAVGPKPVKMDKKEESEDSNPSEVRASDYAKPKQGFGTLGDLLKESMKKQK